MPNPNHPRFDHNTLLHFEKVTLLMLFFALFGFGCASPIPPAALENADPQSAKKLATLDLSQWLSSDIPSNILTLISVDENGRDKYRAYLAAGKHADDIIYLGELSYQFLDTPVQTLVFEAGETRFIVGRIDDAIKGTLDTVDIERFEADSTRWLEALKVSAVHKRIFVVPIFADEFDEWSTVARIAIKTRESLAAATADNSQPASVWEKQFEPVINIQSMLFDATAP